MATFEDFKEAAHWFHQHDGREEPGPRTDDIETLRLTVRGVTSSLVGYHPHDLDSYFMAFVEACNEIFPRVHPK